MKNTKSLSLVCEIGRPVVVFKEKLFAIDGDAVIEVPEATIRSGSFPVLTNEVVRSLLRYAGFSLPFKIESGKVMSQLIHDWSGRWAFGNASGRDIYTLDGSPIDKDNANKFSNLICEIERCSDWSRNTVNYNVRVTGQAALEMIGVGKTVTASSLKGMCAKGESEPRLRKGLPVVVHGKIDEYGVIVGLSSRVTVTGVNGEKISAPYDKVEVVESIPDSVEEGVSDVEPTILASMEFLKTQVHRIYKAKLEPLAATYPAFPPEGDNRWHPAPVTKDESCVCPNCGWRMSSFHDTNEYVCNYCNLRGMVVAKESDSVSILLFRKPAKNRFAIKESRCCANCGLFEFEVGRQGKRSTGYCKASNQCVQAFNVCNVWFPRTPENYGKNLNQHMTNLHYGVKDQRNTGRNDTEDTVYTEADHDKEKERAEKAKVAYAKTYMKVMYDLRKAALALPVATEPSAELAEKWKPILDDPC